MPPEGSDEAGLSQRRARRMRPDIPSNDQSSEGSSPILIAWAIRGDRVMA